MEAGSGEVGLTRLAEWCCEEGGCDYGDVLDLCCEAA